MVAAISAVRYGSDFAFIGLYIVEPALRGQGLGSQVWEAAMARLRGRTIGLDGVVAMQPAYARSGFMLSHRNIRYAGLPRARKALPAGVEALTMADLAVVERYDEPCFGGPRSGFLAAWLAQPRAVAMGVRSGGDLRGFGVMRPAGSGFKVGPLFADDPDIAGDLLGSIAARIGATAEVFLDVPSPNVEAVALAEGRGMVPSFETARMYAGGDPALPIERIFGVTTFELG
jgi:GNAT superfamily N-acetyltransferase